jgi:hypothetical protein
MHVSTSLVIGGLGLILLGVLLWSGSGATAARAQTPLQRPTLTPAPQRPTLTPAPPSSGGHGGSTPAAAPGRITGTVIDLTTGAPAPGIAVIVGDMTVLTDANGNYDRSDLPAGSYSVALALASGQGTPEQGALTIALAAGATVVQHLAFRSPPLATPAPTAAAMPASLPNTGAPASGGGLAIALGVGLTALGIRLRFGRAAAR